MAAVHHLQGTEFSYPRDRSSADADPTATRFRLVYRLHGMNDIDALFSGGVKAPAPWPGAPRSKKAPMYDRDAVSEMLSSAPQLDEVDSRHLHATQPWVVRSGVQHYLTGEYEATGRTFQGGHDVGNAFPVVYTTRRGHNLILSGHHRAASALLRGQPLLARRVQGDV